MLQACFKKKKKLYDSGYNTDKSNQLFYFNYMIKKKYEIIVKGMKI